MHIDHMTAKLATDSLVELCHNAAAAAGWWTDLHTGAAKLAYNAQRADHKPENRRAEGGKAY